MGSISKSFLVLALLAAPLLLVSREVAARDLAETTTEKINKGEVATEKAKAKVGESKYQPGYYGNYGNGGNGNIGNEPSSDPDTYGP
ncbi:hypothetical protein V6N13_045033 [Hibiscus sabdariffa]|uniref:Uncharacterized protein n=1 Tax=Hibiscus sabdariffa TaxID=183260 RepID=A0ABR2RKB9_9ROSI